MADYPAFPQMLNGSSHEVLDDLTIDRATDGTGYGRSLYASVVHRFVVPHVLTYADADTLQQFYLDNKLTVFGFTWTGQGGSVPFANVAFDGIPPKFTELGNGKVRAESRLVTL